MAFNPFDPAKLCELKATSRDKSNSAYMTESALRVCNFDTFSKKYVGKKYAKSKPHSIDALFKDDATGQLYFIEFKNGTLVNKIESFKDELKLKFYCSLFVLLDSGVIADYEYSRKNINFILVYNDAKNILQEKQDSASSKQEEYTFETFADRYYELAGKPPVLFNLDENYKGLLFRSVNTYNQQQFEKFFLSRYESK